MFYLWQSRQRHQILPVMVCALDKSEITAVPSLVQVRRCAHYSKYLFTIPFSNADVSWRMSESYFWLMTFSSNNCVNIFYYKTYFNLQFILLITRSRNQLYGSWKHGKRLMESWNGAFNGWTTSLVRENGIEYCANNGANSVMAIQKVSHSSSNGQPMAITLL